MSTTLTPEREADFAVMPRFCRNQDASMKATEARLREESVRLTSVAHNCLIGIDVGTSAVKAMLIDAAGNELANVARPVAMCGRRPVMRSRIRPTGPMVYSLR